MFVCVCVSTVILMASVECVTWPVVTALHTNCSLRGAALTHTNAHIHKHSARTSKEVSVCCEVKGHILDTNCGVLDDCGKSSFPPETLMSVLEGAHWKKTVPDEIICYFTHTSVYCVLSKMYNWHHRRLNHTQKRKSLDITLPVSPVPLVWSSTSTLWPPGFDPSKVGLATLQTSLHRKCSVYQHKTIQAQTAPSKN